MYVCILSVCIHIYMTMNIYIVDVFCFDGKQYFEHSFNKLLNSSDLYKSNLNLKWLEPKLTKDTVSILNNANIDVVCTFVEDKIDESVVNQLAKHNIKMIAIRAAGFDNVDLTACDMNGITVCRVPTYSPSSIAEHAISLFCTLNRKIHHAYNRVRDQNFSLHGLVGMNIKGKTVGVIGTGAIGSEFVKIMNGFGCNILCHDVVQNQEILKLNNKNIKYVSLNELLSQSNIISLHAPLLPSTRHLINENSIKLMKAGVYIINTSRGALVDSHALIEALKSGKIAGACLDVYEQERGIYSICVEL